MSSARPPLHVALAILLPALAAAVATTTPLVAQDSTAAAVDEWLVGGSVGVPGFETLVFYPAAIVAVHLVHVPVGDVGAEVTLVAAPMSLAVGGLAGGARGGLLVPLQAGQVLILPAGGISLVGAVGTGDGVGGLIAGYLGGSVVGASGVRTGLTFHWIPGEGEPVWLLELGFLRR